MPEEVKELIYTKEERDLGTRRLDKYKQDRYILLRTYIAGLPDLEKTRLAKGSDAYFKARKPSWDLYKKEDKELYENYTDDMQALGYKLRAA